MKIGIITLTLFFGTSIINAQSILVLYEQSANIENQIKKIKDPETRKRVSRHLSKPAYYTLFCQGDVSIYQEKSEEEPSELEMDETVKIIKVGKGIGGIYKNKVTKEYLSEENLLGKQFLVKDTLIDFDWQITTETKKIGTYNCIKAVTYQENHEVTAWFSKEIPVFDGPRGYFGLPGLILELNTPKLNFKVISIKEIKENVEITKPSKGKVVSQQEYNKIREARIDALKNGQMFGN